ncbi:MAG: serine protease [Clostridia bacterium]|nr:serine protease [Clostridia bacterium]
MEYFKSYKRRKKIKLSNFTFVIVIIIFVFFIISILSNKIKSEDNQENDICEEECIEKASKNIVGISKNYNLVNDGSTSWGSGVVISKNGYILTNEHVSGLKNDNCYVILNSKERYKANIVWSNSDIDLAILKIKHNFEDSAVLGDSDELKLGQKIYSIGNPIGLEFKRSVSTGVISGTNRNLEFEENGKKIYINNLIQTDAMINPGNSGGALINKAGQLVGITTVKISSAESMGFAVPINIVKPILKKIENAEMFEETTLEFWGYDKYSIDKINININLDSGIYVGQINLNSNLEKSGIKVGDIIMCIDGKKLEKISDLRRYIYEKSPGDIVKLSIKRDKSEFEVDVKLGRK